MSADPQDHIRAWLASWDFIDNPFALWEAAQEPWLDRYYIRRPFFERLLHQHKSALILAPRGGGKTATRIMVEAECRPRLPSSPVLAVTFNDFSPFIDATASLNTLTLADYTPHLIAAILRRLLVAMANQMTGAPIDSDMLGELSYWVRTYFPSILHPRGLAALLQQAATEREKAQLISIAMKILHSESPESNLSYRLQSLCKLIEDILAAEPIQPPESSQSPTQIIESLIGFVRIILSSGPVPCQAVYLLIDGVDEYMLTQNNPLASVALIRPLLSNLRFLELPGLAVKCFLPAEQRHAFEREARTDRLDIINLEWSAPDMNEEANYMRELLRRRITTFNTRGLVGLGELCAPEMRSWLEDDLLKEAGASPRNLMRLGNSLFEEHCLDLPKPESLLRPEEWGRALARFRELVLTEPEIQDLSEQGPEHLLSLSSGNLYETRDVGPALLRVDLQAGRVYRGDQEIAGLTDMEYRLLETLYRHRGQICTKDTIIQEVWARKYAPDDQDTFDGVTDEAISRLVRRVRLCIEPGAKKVEVSEGAYEKKEAKGATIYLKTIKGRGYMLINTT